MAAVPAGQGVAVSVWPKPPSGITVGQSAGVHFGTETFAAVGTIDRFKPSELKSLRSAKAVARRLFVLS
jgi:hypothetical protein